MSDISDVNFIRSSGGTINSIPADQDLNNDDKEIFFKLLLKTDQYSRPKSKIYSLGGYITKEIYIKMNKKGKRFI